MHHEEEILEILNSRGNSLGCMPRSQVHREGMWHRTVHIWVYTPNGEWVFQKRSDTKDTHPGKWDISVGGHVTAGQCVIDAAIREIWEELGLRIEAKQLRYISDLKQIYESPDGAVRDREIVSVFLLTRPVLLSDLRPDPREVCGLRSVKPLCLSNLDITQFVPHPDEYRLIHDLPSGIELFPC